MIVFFFRVYSLDMREYFALSFFFSIFHFLEHYQYGKYGCESIWNFNFLLIFLVGSDAILLGAETLRGLYPVETISTVGKINAEVSCHFLQLPISEPLLLSSSCFVG